jgi:hypothetical protein
MSSGQEAKNIVKTLTPECAPPGVVPPVGEEGICHLGDGSVYLDCDEGVCYPGDGSVYLDGDEGVAYLGECEARHETFVCRPGEW